MRHFVFLARSGNYFLFHVSFPNPENALVLAHRVTDLEWATQHTGQSEKQHARAPQHGWESVAETGVYLKVDVWPKYFFPTFGEQAANASPAYQWYGLEDAVELHELLHECVRVAAAHGVVVGSR